MSNSLDRRPRLMLLIATVGVIAIWVVAVYLLVYFGFPRNWIIIIAPISSVVVAGVFLYIGRNKLRGVPASNASLELESPIIASDTMGNSSMEFGKPFESPVVAGDSMDNPLESDARDNSPVAFDTQLDSPDLASDTMNARSESDAMNNRSYADLLAGSQFMARDTSTSPVLAVDAFITEFEKRMTAIEKRITQIEKPATEIEKPLTEIEKPITDIQKFREVLRCIIIAAPSHGILQDRLNNWLNGSYGRVVSTSMAMNDKGFFLTVFYEPADIKSE